MVVASYPLSSQAPTPVEVELGCDNLFPEKFPYGTGGYLSSAIDNQDNNLGFANYCVNQIMSCDPKFRNDSTYLFFLLLVKELIMLKRCKSTYLHQATKIFEFDKK